MSAPATFLCPHCSAKYPVKPVLVGKVVRCTTCKNPFRLRPDGVADKVEVGTSTVPKPVAPTAAVPAPVVQAPPAPAPPKPIPATFPTPALGLRPPSDPTAPIATKRLAAAKPQLTQQQLDARKAMADSLSAAAGEALKAAEPSEENSSSGKPDKKGSARFVKPPSDPKKAGKGPAILTGEGEREASITRMWQLAFVGLLVFVGVLAFLVTRTGERTAAVAAFTAVVPPADNRFGRRMEAIQARAWSPEVTAFVDLPSPSIGSEHTIAAAALSEALAPLAGLVYVPTADRWIAPDKVDWLTRQVTEDPKNLPQRLERSGVVNVDNKVVTAALRNANLSDDELAIVHDLLLISGPLAGKLAKGPAPAIRWCTVHGRSGTWLFNPGGGYTPRLSDYNGLLVAFTGDGWPTDWRFLTLAPVQKP